MASTITVPDAQKLGWYPQSIAESLVSVANAAKTDIEALQAGTSDSVQTGSATLVAGVKTVNTDITITASSKVYLQLVTPGGTMGAHHKVGTLVVGGPGTGAFTITAVDASGTLVNTDTSVFNFLIMD